MVHTAICCLATLTLCAAAARGGDWPAFRGPEGSGTAPEKNVPTAWSATENVAWKAALPGPGNSSPIVSAGKVFITCGTEEGKKRTLYCFDRKSGQQLWAKTVDFPTVAVTHQTNPYCGSTPVADGKHVVVWHGSAGLFCYDFEGNEVWATPLGKVTHIWGYGSSPILYGESVVLNFGPGAEEFVVSVELKSGSIQWKKDEPKPAGNDPQRYVGSWSTPVVAQVGGKDQILCSMPTRVVAYEPDTGDIIWTCDGVTGMKGDLSYTSPLISGEFGVAMGGFNGPAMGFRLGGEGNVTETNRLWRFDDKQPQRIGSGVIVGKHVFQANAGPGTAECLELEAGKQLWQQRLAGGTCWGSVCHVDGNLFVTGQNGTTTVFKPNPEKFELVAENTLGEPSNSTPAFSDGQIFLRTHKGLYCVGK